ncbi:flagellar basal body-associated FliL family protein [Rhodobacter sp. Har01]|uniref:flagellar basal body-associated FliL family protein n=1 Tax=Rhodobacter sp. Har01 TaxID=2883999 RepID=UPI001D08386F|nr:flagellar basal body-associated FliL family protein [Rhodobacter sp. Har01]MCB6177942.1 flagellar basal body-associated FliL family protein [Rhodobacter sp. Har01]
MIRKLFPVLLALLGLGLGLAGGLFLRPPPEAPAAVADEGHAPAAEESPPDYVKLNNQFVVPILEGGKVTAMVVLSLSLEVTAGNTNTVYDREPKIRDAFLQVLFDHANTGGFRGSFTDGSNLVVLREALTEKAIGVLGPIVTDVLITEIARQDS